MIIIWVQPDTDSHRDGMDITRVEVSTVADLEERINAARQQASAGKAAGA